MNTSPAEYSQNDAHLFARQTYAETDTDRERRQTQKVTDTDNNVVEIISQRWNLQMSAVAV